MEFGEKLQLLRKQKALTQEELARLLYVSRTAVSKWESGRGYPNLESLKGIAAVFSVTVDELLSGEELLALAEQVTEHRERRVRELVFGLMDIGMALLLFLPFFAQKVQGVPQAVSLLSLTTVTPPLKVLYLLLVSGTVLWGILTLALQTRCSVTWVRAQIGVSVALNAVTLFLCILGLQPYAAVFVLAFLMIKVLILLNRK